MGGLDWVWALNKSMTRGRVDQEITFLEFSIYINHAYVKVYRLC